MNVIELAVKDIIPYEKNPRRNDKAVDAVAESIKQFGFKVPCVVDKNHVLVTGHTRVKACKKLGIKTVPCVVADDLTEDEIRAFRLADNKVGEIATWDTELLAGELADIELDMSDFGFEYIDWEEEHLKNRENYRMDTIRIHNLEKANFGRSGKYDIPQIYPVKEIPEVKEWIGFNYVLSDKDPAGKGVHFFVDDYQFERLWNNPNDYIEKLRQYAVVASPDFSPYSDMPLATQIFNHYRKHWLGRYWQEMGITVIPTIRASADARSLEWYLEGEPEGGVVLISSVWCKDPETKQYFLDYEYGNMMRALKPTRVLVYGDEIEELQNVEYIKTFARKRYG